MEKRLYRSKKESMIAGVAGGIAEYFAIDPVLIRLLFVLSVLFHGTGILAYIILWIVVPTDKGEDAYSGGSAQSRPAPAIDPETGEPIPDPPASAHKLEAEARREKRARLGGYILIGLGVLFLADNLIPHIDLGDYWPLALIALGGAILYNATKKKNTEAYHE